LEKVPYWTVSRNNEPVSFTRRYKAVQTKNKRVGSNPLSIFNVLGDELGFVNISKDSAGIAPYGETQTFYIGYDEKNKYYTLTIKAWKSTNELTKIVNLTPYAVKSTFELFFGEKEGASFFTKFNNGMNGDKEILKYVNTINTINNRQLKIQDTENSVIIQIGEKNKDYKNVAGW